MEKPRGEASLRGHLRGDAAKDKKEESGSAAYVPKEPEKDMQLQYALKLMRGEIPEPVIENKPADTATKSDDVKSTIEPKKEPARK